MARKMFRRRDDSPDSDSPAGMTLLGLTTPGPHRDRATRDFSEESSSAVATLEPEPMSTSPEPQAAATFCTHCGAGLDAGQRFCSECGARVEEVAAESPNVTTPASSVVSAPAPIVDPLSPTSAPVVVAAEVASEPPPVSAPASAFAAAPAPALEIETNSVGTELAPLPVVATPQPVTTQAAVARGLPIATQPPLIAPSEPPVATRSGMSGVVWLVLVLVVISAIVGGGWLAWNYIQGASSSSSSLVIALRWADTPLRAGETRTIYADVQGGSTDLDWSVQPGGGTLVSQGFIAADGSVRGAALYTAPAIPGSYRIEVHSRQSPEVKSVVMVQVR
jgi:hypothetical protein